MSADAVMSRVLFKCRFDTVEPLKGPFLMSLGSKTGAETHTEAVNGAICDKSLPAAVTRRHRHDLKCVAAVLIETNPHPHVWQLCPRVSKKPLTCITIFACPWLVVINLLCMFLYEIKKSD